MLEFIKNNLILAIAVVAVLIIAVVLLVVLLAKKRTKRRPEKQDFFKNAPIVMLGEEPTPTEVVHVKKDEKGKKADFSWVKD